MTLHVAINKILQQAGRRMTTKEIAESLNKNKWYQKKDGSKITDFQIHGRTNNYPLFFNSNGATVSFAGYTIIKSTKSNIISKSIIKNVRHSNKDEQYVPDICDKVLKQSSSRQHRFSFLLGDTNSNGIAVRLPVDAYYEKLNLVIEYRERQHTENITFFDKPNRITVSGVHRGQQRKIHDERRRQLIPKHGLNLVEVSYTDFNFDNQKRIIRIKKKDTEVIRKLLQTYVDRI